MSKCKSQNEIEQKRLEIDAIRRREFEVIPGDPFKRGQLAGAQQALWWILGLGMDPVRAILNDEEIVSLKQSPQFPGIEPVGPLVEMEVEEADLPPCDCGMGDGSMPELHPDDCAISLALVDSQAEEIDSRPRCKHGWVLCSVCRR